jgi:hypothetical protein
MTAKAKVGERLPYLLSALKAPRILERLAATAERAREEQWPYEQFLETLCEAEVFAREASGARQRTRSAAASGALANRSVGMLTAGHLFAWPPGSARPSSSGG